MTNVFAHLKYQDALLEAVAQRKKLSRQWTMRQLASETSLQPSFLTNVLKGRFDFNSDQLFNVAEKLGFEAGERRYLLLLLEYQRSTSANRKKELKVEIDESRKRHLRTEKHISAKPVELSADAQAEYYLDPFVQLAHVYLNLAPYAKAPELLCSALGMSRAHLAKSLELLVRIGYVKFESGRYTVLARNKHLAREAPLCGPHQSLMRMKAIDQLQRLSSGKSYSFSATVSGTEETRDQLKAAFLDFLKKAEAIVKPAESKQVFQMNFDLFPWDVEAN